MMNGIAWEIINCFGEGIGSTSPKKLEVLSNIKIKDVFSTWDAYLFISEDNKLYGFGNESRIGINQPNAVFSGKLEVLNLGGAVDGLLECVNTSYSGNKLPFMKKGEKYYVTGQANIMFGNETIEQNWRLVANNVSFFNGVGSCYVDKNGDLYIAGDSRFCGLGNDSLIYKNITNYVRCTDSNISNKVSKCWQTGFVTYVLLKDKTLWATGLYKSDNQQKQCPGWTEMENKTNFVKILDDVDLFDACCAVGAGLGVRIALKSNRRDFCMG